MPPIASPATPPRAAQPYAGGFAFNLPVIGTMYSTNITPDKETGIGNYTDQQFLDALHKGIRHDGEHLYPGMSYASYTYMTDADALAIKAYLFTLPAVHAPARENKLAWPFNNRSLMAFWNFFYNADTPLPSQSHAKRGMEPGRLSGRGDGPLRRMPHARAISPMRVNNRRKFAGALTAGWRAYNITADAKAGLATWSDNDLATYLSTGHADGHGGAAGPMGEASDNSLTYLTAGDIHALVVYLRSVPAQDTDLPRTVTVPAPASHREGVTADLDPRGEKIFAGACASCHDWTGVSPLSKYATLTGVRAVNDPSATNVAQTVINGVDRNTAQGKIFMPAFGSAYSDDEIAAVSNYVTARFGAEGAQPDRARTSPLCASRSRSNKDFALVFPFRPLRPRRGTGS